MKMIKRMERNMSKYIAQYNSGSIMGRSVYSHTGKKTSSIKSSILGTKVYNSHNNKGNVCRKVKNVVSYLREFQKQ